MLNKVYLVIYSVLTINMNKFMKLIWIAVNSRVLSALAPKDLYVPLGLIILAVTRMFG